MGEFENKGAVITGGASGIGKYIADEFRKNSAKVSVINECGYEEFQYAMTVA